MIPRHLLRTEIRAGVRILPVAPLLTPSTIGLKSRREPDSLPLLSVYGRATGPARTPVQTSSPYPCLLGKLCYHRTANFLCLRLSVLEKSHVGAIAGPALGKETDRTAP